MDHHAHVGFVDTHAKGIRGYNDAYVASCPGFLTIIALLSRKACMIVVSMQKLSEFLSPFAISDIDDG